MMMRSCLIGRYAEPTTDQLTVVVVVVLTAGWMVRCL